jgi:hypothetical protein
VRRVLAVVIAGCLAAWSPVGERPAAASGTAATAGFNAPFTVLAPGCAFTGVSGDAVIGADGITRGFAAFTGGGCPAGRIWYFQGFGGAWISTVSPYTGRVMAVAWDGSATYLLFSQRLDSTTHEVRIASHRASGFSPGRRLAQPTGTAFTSQGYQPAGDVVAVGGRWWAVWTELAPIDDSYSKLFQARTLGSSRPGGVLRRQMTFQQASAPEALSDAAPSLTLAPGSSAASGRAVLAWETDNFADATAVKTATAGYDGRWRSRRWSPLAGLPYIHGPALTTYGGRVLGAYSRPFGGPRWTQRAVMMVDPQSAPPAAFTSVFASGGSSHRIAASRGHTFVAWDLGGNGVMVGDTTAPGRVAQANAVPGARRVGLLALVARRGKATVLGFSLRSHRLWAATQR